MDCFIIFLKNEAMLANSAMYAAEYETDIDGKKQLVKSMECEQRSYVRFTNVSRRSVDIYWINYAGKPEKYKQLLPAEFLDINTFVTHPWIFRDAATQERFVINNNRIFRGEARPAIPVFKNNDTQSSCGSIARTNWNITAPLRDLRTNTMIFLADVIKDVRRMNELELPIGLETELKDAIIKSRR